MTADTMDHQDLRAKFAERIPLCDPKEVASVDCLGQ
jgi:hypothetical protein